MNDTLEGIWYPLQTLNSPRYAQNLAYLSTLDPILHQQLLDPAPGEDLCIQQNQRLIRCRTCSQPITWIFGESSPRQELQTLLQNLKDIVHRDGLIVLLGSAAGNILPHLLPLFLRNPNQKILLIEPSTARIQMALNAVDLRPALANGRMHIALAKPTMENILAVIDRFSLWNETSIELFPTTKNLEPISAQEFEQAYRDRSTLKQRERIERFARLRTYTQEKTPSTVRRVFLVDFWPGSPQNLHIRSIQSALHKRSIEAEIFPLQGYLFDLQGAEYRRQVESEFLQRIDEFQPDLIVSYAYHAPQILSEIEFEALGIPWLQVVSNIAYYDQTYYPGEYSAMVERKLIPLYRTRGAAQPFFLPIMANYAIERPLPTTRQQKIVFVGNSLGLTDREVTQFHQQIRARTRLLRYIQDAENALGDFDRDLNLYDYLDTHPAPQVENEKEHYDIFRYLLCQGTAARRHDLLHRIADRGLALYGNWGTLPKNSLLLPCMRGVLPLDREPSVFSEGHLFINIHSVGHVTGPNMRFFNTPGLGGCMISDGSFGEFLTPGSEYIRYTTKQEFCEMIGYYLNRPQETEAIRTQGLERIQRQWTYDHWVDHVFRELGFN